MSIQSGVFTYDRGAVLDESGDNVWSEGSAGGATRHPSGLAVTWDGRIDNRDELLTQLGDVASGAPDDRRLAAGMFARGGVAGLTSIVGEWALVIWDAAA